MRLTTYSVNSCGGVISDLGSLDEFRKRLMELSKFLGGMKNFFFSTDGSLHESSFCYLFGDVVRRDIK